MRIGVSKDGPRVLLAARAGDVAVTLDLHRRGASALAAVLAARADDDEDSDSELSVAGSLTTSEQHEKPSPL